MRLVELRLERPRVQPEAATRGGGDSTGAERIDQQ